MILTNSDFFDTFQKLSDLEQKDFIRNFVIKMVKSNLVRDKRYYVYSLPEDEIFSKDIEVLMPNVNFQNLKDLRIYRTFIRLMWTIENFVNVIEVLIKDIYLFNSLNEYWVNKSNDNQFLSSFILKNEKNEILSLCEKERILNLYLRNHQWLLLLLFKIFMWRSKYSILPFDKELFSIEGVLNDFLENKKEMNEINLKQLKDDLFPNYLNFCWYDYYKNKNILFSFFTLILCILKIRFNIGSMREVKFGFKFTYQTLGEFYNITLDCHKKQEKDFSFEGRYSFLLNEFFNEIDEELWEDYILNEIKFLNLREMGSGFNIIYNFYKDKNLFFQKNEKIENNIEINSNRNYYEIHKIDVSNLNELENNLKNKNK